MGYQQNSRPLVSMTNKDVYYVTKLDAKKLMAIMAAPGENASTFETVDAKSGAEIAITIAEISSVVIPKDITEEIQRNRGRYA